MVVLFIIFRLYLVFSFLIIVLGINQETTIDVKTSPIRPLPDKVIVGYSHLCNDGKAETAIRQGINILIWSFLDIQSSGKVTSKLDLECIRKLIRNMNDEGYDDTVHLVSFGGWDGPHFENTQQMSPEELYFLWKLQVGNIFHGIDFDFEGNDNLASPNNEFTLEDLDKLGKFCQLAKEDGYAVSMAPPQSYLDIDTSRFSRYVNLTDPDRHWHSDFQYFGANVYAHTLAKYGDFVDLVQVQFYESYARAAMEVLHDRVSPERYLVRYNSHLAAKNETFFVEFESDPSVELTNQFVELPLSKLVWGFGNGWVDTPNDKNVYFPPDSIAAAYGTLRDRQAEPRGFMFWCVGEEGKNGVYYAKALNEILHIRSIATEEFERPFAMIEKL